MIRDWIQAIGSILQDANQNRFNEQINELHELYGLRDSDYDTLNSLFTNIFNKELDIDKAILFKYWIFNSNEVFIPIKQISSKLKKEAANDSTSVSQGRVFLRLNTAIANISVPDGRYCLIKVVCAADPYSNTLYIYRADAHINLS